MSTSELHTDGNALAGLLQEIFVAEATSAGRVCQSCGSEHQVGSHPLYSGAGQVLRCPGCGDVAASIAVLPDRHVVSLHGTWSFERTA